MKTVRNIGSNQTEVSTANGTKGLVSYSTLVAVTGPKGSYRTSKHYSVTTSRHINQWGAKDWQQLDPDALEAMLYE